MNSKAYTAAYKATTKICTGLDFIADHLVLAADAVVNTGARAIITAKDIGRGIRDASSDAVLIIPPPRSKLIVDGHEIARD